MHIIHKQTKNIIHTFIQSIKDVAHHHIVKESKEKADNDDSKSKSPFGDKKGFIEADVTARYQS